MLWQRANNKTQLYILDLDGTLMPCARVDNRCYWRAVFECFELEFSPPDISGFKHVTDSGILHEWCMQQFGRNPSGDETGQIKERFFQLLQDAATGQASDFRPLAGVEDWLQTVEDDPMVLAAIATGGWQHTARLKLELSGLDRFALPLASSDDAIARTEIMQIAARKLQHLNQDDDAVISYIGDGVWDLEASRKLDWTFIGIADGPAADHLRKCGAVHVLADFRRPETEKNIGII